MVKVFALCYLAMALASCQDVALNQQIDELVPDDSSLDVNNDGLGGGPEGLVDDLIVGSRPMKGESENQRNCSSELISHFTNPYSWSKKVEVTWSIVVNSFSFDPIKNQMTLVADSILSWNYKNPKSTQACRNVGALVFDPAEKIWTPKFVFLNNLDTSTDLLPSEAWEKWPAVVHPAKQLVTWHFASRFTVPCSFRSGSLRQFFTQCPVKIAGVTSRPQFIFKAGQLSVLSDEQKLDRVKFSIESSAADDMPALALLSELDLTQFQSEFESSSILRHSFHILRVRIMSLQDDSADDPRSLMRFRNFHCFVTFIGSFLVFLLTSVSVTLLILTWYERKTDAKSTGYSLSGNKSINPPSYYSAVLSFDVPCESLPKANVDDVELLKS